MTAPDPGFQFWTHGRHELLREAMLAELQDEAVRRRDYYPKAVAKGRMSELEVQHELNLIDALVSEFGWTVGAPRPRNPFSWAQKVNGLRREIQIRRSVFPAWVRQGRLGSAEAMRRQIAIEACHAWYWHHGLDFMEGARPEDRRNAIRAELARRASWAEQHDIDPASCAGIFTGDWDHPPSRSKEQAA